MQPEARKLIWDALQAASRITQFVEGADFNAYCADDLLRSGVERQFEIIGDALGRLAKLDPGWSARIPDLPRTVAFRNVLIHGYASVDDTMVWGVIERNLPRLKGCLEKITESEGAG
jgi:uncharacterized protein with HEPN domain